MKYKIIYILIFSSLGLLSMDLKSQTICNKIINVSISQLDSLYYTTDSSVTLKGNPTGGMFYGTGVVNGKFIPSDLMPGDYTIAYAYIDTKGCSNAICQDVSIIKGTGIDTTKYNIGKVLISPNPCSDKFSIYATIQGKQTLTIAIYDLTGLQIYSENVSNDLSNFEKEIDVSNFAVGIYLVKVSSNYQDFISRIVIIGKK